MGTTSEKLTYLNETKSKIKDNINLTGAGLTNQTPFRQYAIGLKTALLNILNNGIDTLYNNFPQTTGTGTNITLNNTLEAPIKSELLGNTSQNGTPTPDSPVEIVNATGNSNVKVINRNLLNVTDAVEATTNGVTYRRENQTYYLSGTNTKTDTVWVLPNNMITDLPIFEIGEKYTLKITGNIPNGVYLQVNARNQSNTNYSLWSQISDNNAHTITIGNEYKTTAQVFIGIKATATDVTGSFTVKIEKGSIATEYEAYKEQNYEVNLGKNLFNYNDLSSKIQTFNISGTANEFTINGVGTYQYPISLKGQHTISGNWSTTNLNGDVRLIYEDDTFDNIFSSYSSTSTSGNINFQSNASKNIKVIQFRTFNSSNITLTDFQIEKGSTATPYSPYFTPIELCKIGDYKDRIYKSGGKWYLENKHSKIDSYNGETITTDYISTTGGLDTGATIYYGVETTTTEITEQNYPTLYSELNSLLSAKSYDGTTNITITAETPADIKITALKNE